MKCAVKNRAVRGRAFLMELKNGFSLFTVCGGCVRSRSTGIPGSVSIRPGVAQQTRSSRRGLLAGHVLTCHRQMLLPLDDTHSGLVLVEAALPVTVARPANGTI